MALWQWLSGLLPSPLILCLGTVVGAVLVLWFWRRRSRNVMTHEDQGFDPNEHKRRADYLAADAARATDARIPPQHQGGFNF